MAELVGAIFTSHAWVDRPWTEWERQRLNRSIRADVPIDSDAEMMAKAERMARGSRKLKDKLYQLAPDVLVIFGDDQYECFNFNNFPAVAVYVGETFATRSGKTAAGHPPLAKAVLTGLMERNFDPAFCMGPPNPERGMSHAFMNPLSYYNAYHIPTVPIFMNAYYAPQVSARRHYQVGKAVREIIDVYPEDLRVVVVGSGGLWHTPYRDSAWLNEDFDRVGLELLSKGLAADWAEHFDNYKAPVDDPSQDIMIDPSATETHGPVEHLTRMESPGGPQGGSRETCNWIGAAGVIEGRPSVIVDYVPVYASPLGVAFAYCDDI
jgi:Catalytic LigB subunit of aromatic ring-opening dioxygenase